MELSPLKLLCLFAHICPAELNTYSSTYVRRFMFHGWVCVTTKSLVEGINAAARLNIQKHCSGYLMCEQMMAAHLIFQFSL